MLRRLRFISNISVLYILTVGVLVAIAIQSRQSIVPVHAESPSSRVVRTMPSHPEYIGGKPVRITIDATSINLNVTDGYYDAETNSWTLGDTVAQYAVISQPANNTQGTTFIYGHGTDVVFGKLNDQHPPTDTLARVQIASGKTFTYSLTDIRDYSPTDISILQNLNDGPPRLIIQTCSGALSQWRTMFIFNFENIYG